MIAVSMALASTTVWGVGLVAAAAVLLGAAVSAVVKAKHAEGDLSGVFANASRAAFMLAWACPLAFFGLYLLGVAPPEALVPGFVVLGCLAAALLIASAVLGIRRSRSQGGKVGP